MEFFNTVLGIPLGHIIHFAFILTGSYGLSVILFAIVSKFFLFPMSILAHKNSIKLLQIQPVLNRIKKYYSDDKERMYEEQNKLFKDEKYNPYLGVLPLVVRLILIIGIMQVMYHPLQHMLRLDQGAIDSLVFATREIYGALGGAGEQLRVIEALQNPENLQVFQAALTGFPDANSIISQAAGIDLNFLGVNLGAVPSLTSPSVALVIPLLAGLTALTMCLVQISISPGSLSQGKKTNIWFASTTVAISLWFTLVTPTGVGLYWMLGNILGTLVLFITNLMYSPKKLAADALEKIKSERKTPPELREERQLNSLLRTREKQDVAKFKAAKKQLTFYAISGGQYKYYKNIIDYIHANSDIIIHYLTNDPDDSLFKQDNPKLIPYYASKRKSISLMLKLNTDIMVTTVPGLESYQMKRSILRDDTEYIYTIHGLVSGVVMGKEGSKDYFDTLFCLNSSYTSQERKREEISGLPRKTLVKVGSGVYDQLVDSYASISHIVNEKPQILIAPSWQDDNILDLCIYDMLKSLLGNDYNIIIRPHPQYTSMFPERLEELEKQYAASVATGELTFELDFSGNDSIFMSDILITDWSNIGFEFAYSTLKPCIFINTPMKILNPNYEQYGPQQIIELRDKVGAAVDLNDVVNLDKTVAQLITNKDAYRNKIEQIVHQNLYHPGRSGEAGGKYLIKQIKKRGEISG